MLQYLIDDDVREIAQDAAEPLVSREHRRVQHVGVGKDDVGLLRNDAALPARGVSFDWPIHRKMNS